MRRKHWITMARYGVLAHLDMAGGRLGLSELAAAIVLSPSGLSKLLDRMDASGLIRRDPDPDDARAAFATITPRGRALVQTARASHHALLRETFARSLNDVTSPTSAASWGDSPHRSSIDERAPRYGPR